MQEEKEIIRLLRSITSTLSATLNHTYEPFGMTGVQCLVLMEVYGSKEEVTIGDLAKQLMMSNSNLSAIVKRMVQRDLLYRSRSREDERIVCISLTDNAKSLIEQMEACVFQRCSFLADIQAAQRVQIIESLILLDEAMKGGLGDEQSK